MHKCETNHWVRIASKSRPGRFYLFNKSTGETQWSPLKEEKIGEKQNESPTKLSISGVSKTPAQDRLKRLQHNLKSSQTKSCTSNTKRHATNLKEKTSKEQENELKDEPPSSPAKRISTFAKKAKKRASSSSSGEVVRSIKSSMPSSLDGTKKIRMSDSLDDNSSTSTSNEPVILETCPKISKYSKDSTANNILENSQNIEDNSSKLHSLRSGIVRKIKQICKIPFSISKKSTDEKLLTNYGKSSSLSSSTKFKATRKTKPKQCLSTAGTEAISKLISDEIGQSAEKETLTRSLNLNTPKNLSIPSYPRGSANSRLERLKQSLILQQNEQQQQCSTTNNRDTLDEISNFSPESNNNKVVPLQIVHSLNNSINSSHKSANDTYNDDIEAMDWQPILKDEDPIEKSGSESTLIVEKSRKLSLQKINADENQTMGDIIDAVNENLLRLSAEKQKNGTANNKKWRKDFYYFIVDTNVLLRDLTFVEDLSKMKVCDTKGSILYIPYSVLQELDKLKMRSGSQEGVKTLTVRAIKYLNAKFENNSPNLQAQSALDEHHRLVDITSADDSIINCCLQVKEHISNIILLTEDVNLRSKAICNNIIVSTKSDLLAKRFKSSGEP